MRITFLLPRYTRRPVGGYAVVYEYANRLQARGHQVTLVHPRQADPLPGWSGRLRGWCWPHLKRRREPKLVAWFPLRGGVDVRLVPDLREAHIPRGDAVFATSWHTAPWVNRYAASRGKKFYLVQHYETWAGPRDQVDATWRMPLHKVVIARWLWELGESFGERSRMTYIPNGIDVDRFRLQTPIESRDRYRVAMLHHWYEWKGTSTGLAALERVREQLPQLDLVLFGNQPRGPGVPTWATYVESPQGEELVRLYNSCAIFVHPSWAEGWPLPPAEAMA